MATTHYLDKFTLFSKLPIELRLQIFKHAIPKATNNKDEKCVIRVTPSLPRIPKSNDTRVAFQIHKMSGYGTRTSPELFDIGLLGACVESRDFYLKAFQGCADLWTIGGGLVRYDENTFIYIDNLWGFRGIDTTTDHMREAAINCFKNIKKLALNIDDLSIWRRRRVGFRVFQNILALAVVEERYLNFEIYNPRENPLSDNYIARRTKHMVSRVRGEFEYVKNHSGLEHNLPELVVWE
jgi:hypothetical protein